MLNVNQSKRGIIKKHNNDKKIVNEKEDEGVFKENEKLMESSDKCWKQEGIKSSVHQSKGNHFKDKTPVKSDNDSSINMIKDNKKKLCFKIETSSFVKSSLLNPVFPILHNKSNLEKNVFTSRWDSKEKIQKTATNACKDNNVPKVSDLLKDNSDKMTYANDIVNQKNNETNFEKSKSNISEMPNSSLGKDNYNFMADESDEENFEDYIIRINCSTDLVSDSGEEEITDSQDSIYKQKEHKEYDENVQSESSGTALVQQLSSVITEVTKPFSENVQTVDCTPDVDKLKTIDDSALQNENSSLIGIINDTRSLDKEQVGTNEAKIHKDNSQVDITLENPPSNQLKPRESSHNESIKRKRSTSSSSSSNDSSSGCSSTNGSSQSSRTSKSSSSSSSSSSSDSDTERYLEQKKYKKYRRSSNSTKLHQSSYSKNETPWSIHKKKLQNEKDGPIKSDISVKSETTADIQPNKDSFLSGLSKPNPDRLVDYKSDGDSSNDDDEKTYKLFPANDFPKKNETSQKDTKKLPPNINVTPIKMFLKSSTAHKLEKISKQENTNIDIAANQESSETMGTIDTRNLKIVVDNNENIKDVKSEDKHLETFDDKRKTSKRKSESKTKDDEERVKREKYHKPKSERRSRSRSRRRRSSDRSSSTRKRLNSRSEDSRYHFSRSHHGYREKYTSGHYKSSERDKKGKDSKHTSSVSKLTGKPVVSKEFHKLAEEIKETSGARNIMYDDLGPIESAPAGYCFVEFPDTDTAHNAMLRLNGKGIPGSKPPKLFKLNHASFGREHLLIPEYSLYVGELTKDVDDMALYRAFASRYSSVRAAKVVIDSKGENKGFGFVRFRSEEEQQLALIEMQNFSKLGGKLIRVSLAIPKKMQAIQATMNNQPMAHSFHQQMQGTAYNNQYFQQYPNVPQYGYGAGAHPQAWWGGQYQDYYGNYHNTGITVPGVTEDNSQPSTSSNFDQDGSFPDGSIDPYNDETLEDPEIEIDVEKANKEFMERSEELYLALEGSRWHPLDNVFSQIVPDLQVKS